MPHPDSPAATDSTAVQEATEDDVVGRAEGQCDKPMDVWSVIESALWEVADEDGDAYDRYPTSVEVTVRVE